MKINRVDPVYDKSKETEFIRALEQIDSKYKIMWRIGAYCGYRVSDLLSVRVGTVKKNMAIREAKTGLKRRVVLNVELLKEISTYIREKGLQKGDYLIPRRDSQKNKPLSRVQAWRILASTASLVGLGSLGTHSMRKTYASNLYANTGQIDAVQRALGHKYMTTTLTYLLGSGKKLAIIDES